jgi:hypothetical protein
VRPARATATHDVAFSTWRKTQSTCSASISSWEIQPDSRARFDPNFGQKKSRPLFAVGSANIIHRNKAAGSHLHPFESTLAIKPYVTDDQDAQKHKHARQGIYGLQAKTFVPGGKQHGPRKQESCLHIEYHK